MSEPGRPDALLVGRVVGVFGLRGDVKVAASLFEIQPGVRLTARDARGAEREVIVSAVRPGKGHLRVLFEGVSDANGAEELRGMTLHAPISALPPLPANAYREAELVGMRVTDERLGDLGDVVGIAHYPGSDMLVVGPKRLLVPMLEAYGVQVNRAARTIATTLPPGFEELL